MRARGRRPGVLTPMPAWRTLGNSPACIRARMAGWSRAMRAVRYSAFPPGLIVRCEQLAFRSSTVCGPLSAARNVGFSARSCAVNTRALRAAPSTPTTSRSIVSSSPNGVGASGAVACIVQQRPPGTPTSPLDCRVPPRSSLHPAARCPPAPGLLLARPQRQALPGASGRGRPRVLHDAAQDEDEEHEEREEDDHAGGAVGAVHGAPPCGPPARRSSPRVRPQSSTRRGGVRWRRGGAPGLPMPGLTVPAPSGSPRQGAVRRATRSGRGGRVL